MHTSVCILRQWVPYLHVHRITYHESLEIMVNHCIDQLLSLSLLFILLQSLCEVVLLTSICVSSYRYPQVFLKVIPTFLKNNRNQFNYKISDFCQKVFFFGNLWLLLFTFQFFLNN